MAKATSSRVSLPIPRVALKALEEDLRRSLKGWDRCPPKWVSPPPGKSVKGAYFDVSSVVRVVEQLRAMPHTAGKWGGTPFDPEPWQVVWVLAPVFGWKYPNGMRIVRELWKEIPRKAGKTSLASRLALILLAGDQEWGAEVYAAAGAREQAGFVFEPAKVVAEKSAALKGRVEVLSRVIRAPRTGGVFRVLSKAGDLAFGANVHGGVIDEIHVHKTRELIDAISTGTAAREQPLVIFITTADDGDETSIYAEKHGHAIDLAEGRQVDPSVFAVIWAADRSDDPFSEKTWRKANPNYPITPTKEFLQTEARKAKARPSSLPKFLRLHLNVRMADEGKRVDWDWMASAGSVVETKLKGQKCWGGLVTRTAQDLTAIAWTFRSPDKGHGDEWWTLWRHFLPGDRFASLLERTNGAAEQWKRQGWIRFTEGDVIDVAAHLEQIREDSGRFEVQEFAYDPNGAIGIVSSLIEEDRFTVVPIYANTPGSALIDWEGLVRAEKYRHGANPVVAWQMGNLVLRESASGVTKVDPKASHDVVPGAVAAEMALRRALLAVEKQTKAIAMVLE